MFTPTLDSPMPIYARPFIYITPTQCWVTFECNSEALNSRSKNGMLWKQSICFENGLELSHHIPAVYSTIYCTWIGIQKMGSRETRAVESPFKNVHLFWLDLNRRMAIPLWMWPNIDYYHISKQPSAWLWWLLNLKSNFKSFMIAESYLLESLW